MMLVDSECRRYLTSWDACESAARDFVGSGWEDYDLTALAGALFERVTMPGETRFYERPEVSEGALLMSGDSWDWEQGNPYVSVLVSPAVSAVA